MKKFLCLMAVAALLLVLKMPVISAERELECYTVEATTYPITEVATMETQIAGDVRIHHILISNDDPTIEQTISIYSLSDSTITVTLEFQMDLATGTVAGFPIVTQIPFPIPASPWTVHDFSVRKDDVLSTVLINVWYR